MASAPASGHGLVAKAFAALLLVGGPILLLTAIAGWQKEFAFDPGVSLGTAKVVQINPNPPNDSARKTSQFRCYPVFEYVEKSGRRRQLAGKAAIAGYFKIGDEVPIAQLRARVTVMDLWFRAQDYCASALMGALAIALGVVIIKTNRTKTYADAGQENNRPSLRDRAIF